MLVLFVIHDVETLTVEIILCIVYDVYITWFNELKCNIYIILQLFYNLHRKKVLVVVFSVTEEWN